MVSNFNIYGSSWFFIFMLRKDKQNQNNLLITFRLCIYIKSPIFSNSSHIQLLKLFNCFSVGLCNGTIQIEYGIENVNQLLFVKTDNLLFHSAKPAFPFFLFYCGPLSKIFIQLPREKKNEYLYEGPALPNAEATALPYHLMYDPSTAS